MNREEQTRKIPELFDSTTVRCNAEPTENSLCNK